MSKQLSESEKEKIRNIRKKYKRIDHITMVIATILILAIIVIGITTTTILAF